MSDSMLQKDFRERDVQRMRNIISKKYGDKTVTQVGYKKEQIDYKEGDTWEENGKKYTIKNGIKVTISKLDLIRKLFQMPLCCPKCGKPMKNVRIDKKMWSLHKTCFNCVLEYESLLKQKGIYKEYEQNLLKKGLNSYIKDLEEILEDIINNSNDTIVTEEGTVEDWSGGDMSKITNELKKYIEKLKTV